MGAIMACRTFISRALIRCSVSTASFDLIVGTGPAAVLKDALAQALLMKTRQELNG